MMSEQEKIAIRLFRAFHDENEGGVKSKYIYTWKDCAPEFKKRWLAAARMAELCLKGEIK